MAETALVALAPEAEAVIGDVRRRHAPDAAFGMPAHFTLLYPFADTAAVDAALEDRVARVCRALEPAEVTLAQARRFVGDDPLLYLEPQPAGPVADLIRALTDAFPEYPLYGGAYDEIVPHLTVARAGDLLDRIEAEIAPSLPIETVLDAAWLWERGADGWRARRRFRFGTDSARSAS